MAAFTTLSLEEATEIFKLYDLPRPVELIPLQHGISNTNYQVITESSHYLLKVSNDKNIAELQAEMQILDQVKKAGYRFCVVPFNLPNGSWVYQWRNYYGVVAPFVAAQVPIVHGQTCYQIGKALGALHALSQKKRFHHLRDYSQVGYDENRIEQYVRNPQASQNFVKSFKRLFPRGLRELYRLSVPEGLIHGDLYFDNTLFKDQKLASVLDFEQAGWGRFLLDMGISISGTCLKDFNGVKQIHRPYIEKFMAGYKSERRLTPPEYKYLDDYILLGLFSIALWRIKRFRDGNLDQSRAHSYRELLTRAESFRPAHSAHQNPNSKPPARKKEYSKKDIIKLKQAYFASCPKGLENTLYQELRKLEVPSLKLGRGGIHFSGSNEVFLPVLFYSRTASRVYKKIYEFYIQDEKDLYEYCQRIKWKSHFQVDQSFKIVTTLGKDSRFHNSLYLTQKAKDAIVDRFKADTGSRPNIEIGAPDMALSMHIEPALNGSEKVTLSVDLVGMPLYHRGYRVGQTLAPVKENLAAAIILNTKWNARDQIFIDSMCGSGTFLIEACLIKGDIPPTFLKLDKLQKGGKLFAFLNMDFFSKDKYLQENFKLELKRAQNKSLSGFESLKKNQFYGYDLNPKDLSLCRLNIQTARLEQIIHLSQKDAEKLKPPVKKQPEIQGIILCNPPYGDRMGETEELSKLYYQYAENLKKNFKNYIAYIFTGNPELRKQISLRTSARIPFFNGPIDCRLLEYELY